MPEPVQYSVILPAYHEEENLRWLIPRLQEVLVSVSGDKSYEIIVVDTVTPLDATAELCLKQGITYLNRQPTNAYGDAVRTGIQAAKGNWIIFMDADGSHTPEFIPKMIVPSETHDIVIASRYIQGGHTENNRLLIGMSWIVNLSYALILNLNCKDVSNSFKLYRAYLLKNISLRCQNFDIVEEILFKIKKKYPEVRLKEIPFSFKKRLFGKTKRNLVIFMFSFLFTLVKLRLSK